MYVLYTILCMNQINNNNNNTTDVSIHNTRTLEIICI